MATPRKTLLGLFAFISCSTRAERHESGANVSIEVATQAAAPCPKGQQKWILKRGDSIDPKEEPLSDERVHCLPEAKTCEDASKFPTVRATDKWCCGPVDKLMDKKCQKACLSRSGKEYCVPFCEDPAYVITRPVDCANGLGLEMYRFILKQGQAGSKERRHCLPQRKRWKGIKAMAELNVSRVPLGPDERGCCSGQPEGKMCFKACVDKACMKVCEYPHSEIRPLNPCPPGHTCYQTNCKYGSIPWPKSDDIWKNWTMEKQEHCKPGTIPLYPCGILCPRPEKQEPVYECGPDRWHMRSEDWVEKSSSDCRKDG